VQANLTLSAPEASYQHHSKATPAEVAWSLKTGTPDLAIDLWIGDMKTIADVATATG
jgi:hypothetical protein